MSALRGLDMIRFCCPRCTGDGFMTESLTGVCKGCSFVWRRADDFKVFVRLEDGGVFRSRAELEAFTGPACGCEETYPQLQPGRINHGPGCRGATIRVHVPISSAHPSFAELLHDLLVEAMNRPPTLGVVGMWSREQQYLALRWASGEVLHAAGVEVARARVRPEFVEEGAGTA